MRNNEDLRGSDRVTRRYAARRGGAPLLSCFLRELSRPLHIYSSEAWRGEARRGAAQRSALSSPTPRQMSPSSQACISGAKHKAFRGLNKLPVSTQTHGGNQGSHGSRRTASASPRSRWLRQGGTHLSHRTSTSLLYQPAAPRGMVTHRGLVQNSAGPLRLQLTPDPIV